MLSCLFLSLMCRHFPSALYVDNNRVIIGSSVDGALTLVSVKVIRWQTECIAVMISCLHSRSVRHF